jgi:flagellar protein FliS
MNPSARDAYLETEVATATPQRLRLMLIEAALRRTRQAETALAANQLDDARAALARSREIVGELLAGIQPDQSPVAKTVLGLYAYLLSTLTEIGQTRDAVQLAGVLRVLEEERETWQQVCLQLPDRPVAEHSAAAIAEELAPQRIGGELQGSYGGDVSASAVTAGFSMDA